MWRVPFRYNDDWQKAPAQEVYDNAFKKQWELYLKHIVKGGPFQWDLLEGAKGVQLAEKGLESWAKRAWVDVPALEG
jgi:predicted dehydrogenase